MDDDGFKLVMISDTDIKPQKVKRKANKTNYLSSCPWLSPVIFFVITILIIIVICKIGTISQSTPIPTDERTGSKVVIFGGFFPASYRDCDCDYILSYNTGNKYYFDRVPPKYDNLFRTWEKGKTLYIKEWFGKIDKIWDGDTLVYDINNL